MANFDKDNKEVNSSENSTQPVKNKFVFAFGNKPSISVQNPEEYKFEKTNQHHNKFEPIQKKPIFEFESLNKKERFEQFLTYRKRLSRLALVQCCYLYEITFLTSDKNFTSEATSSHIDKGIRADEIVKSVIFLYRNIFFYGRYGPINKKKKLEEKWLYDSLSDIIRFVNELDETIRHKLSKKWTVYKLDPTVRAILRSACYEMLYHPSVSKNIVVSEYVKLSTSFYDDAKIFGFINGLLDSIAKSISINDN